MLKRRLVSVVLLTGLLLGLAGCGDSAEESDPAVLAESVYENVMSEDDYSYVFESDPSFEEITGVCDYYANGGYLYFRKYDENMGNSLCRADRDGNVESLVDVEMAEGEFFYSLVPSADEHIGVLISRGYSIILMEYDGNGLKEIGDVTSIVDSSTDIMLDFYRVPDGYVAVMGEKIVKYDESLQEVSSVESQIGCSCLDKNGNVVIGHIELVNKTVSRRENRCIISVYDVNSGKIENRFESWIEELSDIYTGTDGYDIYMWAGNIYGLNYSDKTETKVVSLSETGVVSSDYDGYAMLDEKTMLASKLDFYDSEGPVTSTLEKYVPEAMNASASDPVEKAENELTVAVLSGTTALTDIKQMVNAYNNYQDDYKITVIDYSEQGIDEGIIALNNDIDKGNIPDLYDVSMNSLGDMSLDQAVAKGFLEDVTPYMDSDQDFDTSLLIPSVYEAMKIDGKIYFVSPGFIVDLICTKDKSIGDGYGWTTEEWNKYVLSRPSNYAMSSESDNLYVFIDYIKNNLNEYVDWKTGGCYFDSDDFKNILEACNRSNSYDGTSSDENNKWIDDKIKKGEFLMMPLTLGSGSSYVWRKEEIGGMGIKGYPMSSGAGIIADFDMQIAMSVQCDKKEAAWDFMKFCMSKDAYDKEVVSDQTIPVGEAAYKEFEEKLKAGRSEDETEISVRAFTDEEASEYRDIIDNISVRCSFDRNIIDIIREEALGYFMGDKTVDEACAEIQDKVHTYVNENK